MVQVWDLWQGWDLGHRRDLGHGCDLGHGWDMRTQPHHARGADGRDTVNRALGMCGMGLDGQDRDEPCRNTVLCAHQCPPAVTWGGLRRATGTPEGVGGRQGQRGPPSTHGKAGGPRGPGVARLSWRSLCVRMVTLQCHPPGATSVPLSPHLPALTGSPLAPASPAGPRSPWRPLVGRREEMQGVLQPLGAVPTWQQDLAQPWGLWGLWDPARAPSTPGTATGTGDSAQVWWGHSNPGAVTLGGAV